MLLCFVLSEGAWGDLAYISECLGPGSWMSLFLPGHLYNSGRHRAAEEGATDESKVMANIPSEEWAVGGSAVTGQRADDSFLLLLHPVQTLRL